MKLLRLITIIMIFPLTLFGQESKNELLKQKIILESNEYVLSVLLKELKENHNLNFVYNSRELPLTTRIIFDKKTQTVESVLNEICRLTGHKFIIMEKQIILKKEKLVFGYKISGFVEDLQSGEPLIGANVFDDSYKFGMATDKDGFFSFATNYDELQLNFSYIGYQSQKITVPVIRDSVLKIQLNPSLLIDEVVISNKMSKLEDPQTSRDEVPVLLMRKAPVIVGEPDILKSLMILPGVQQGIEGTGAYYVRGGNLDENLVLLDNMPIYNVNHLFGLFSVFNTAAIQNATLIKGGMPARFGGRASSVLDVITKQGNREKIHGEGGIGLINSGLTLEGPIKEKTTFLISGRRTYLDVLTVPIFELSSMTDKNYKNYGGYFFHDVIGKITHEFSSKSKLQLIYYTGKDKYWEKDFSNYDETRKEKLDFSWGNMAISGRWTNMINDKMFVSTSFAFSRYRFLREKSEFSSHIVEGDTISYSDNYYKNRAFITDQLFKTDFIYSLTSRQTIRFGASLSRQNYSPTIEGSLSWDIDPFGISVENNPNNASIISQNIDFYIEDQIKIANQLTFEGGLRLNNHFVRKSYEPYLEPRVSGCYLINNQVSLKTSYSRVHQYLFNLSYSTLELPVDIWVPATDRIKPMVSNQFVIGMFYIKKPYSISFEVYYKNYDNTLSYKQGASPNQLEISWEEKVTQGNGKAFGLEISAEKKTDKLFGYVSYTLSKSDRQFDELNLGKVFPFDYDRRHKINFVLAYEFNERIDFALNWCYFSGRRYSLSFVKHESAMDFIPADLTYYSYTDVYLYENRNSEKFPAYHRLDAGINIKKQKKRYERIWSFGIYNVYCHLNAITIDHTYDKIIAIGMVPVVPTIQYRFKF